MDGMDETIENTAQFQFPVASPRPSWAEIAVFLKQLNGRILDIETAYKTAQDRSLFVKFVTREAMMESLERNSGPRKFQYDNGKTVDVRMSIAGSNVRYVRVFDLPPEVSDDKLSLVLTEYGKVESMIREKFPANLGLDHMYNGVRGVHIDLKKEIPPAIKVGNKKGHIFYDGLKNTCFLCQAVGHRRDSCPQRQPQDKQVKDRQPVSYAGIVSGEDSVSAEQQSFALSEDIIELTEDEIIEESSETGASEQLQTVASGSGSDKDDKERRRKEGIEALVEVAHAINDAVVKQQAAQRRAQFASSGSGSKEHSRPKKLCARKSFY